MKIKFLFIFLIVSSKLYAKKNNIEKLNGGYYYFINKAELKVIDSAFFLADSLYSIAFSVAKRPLGQDYFLASINATELKSDSLVIGYLKKAVLYGVQLKQIDQNQKLKKYFFLSQIDLKKCLNYRVYRKNYLNGLDFKMQRKIRRLVFFDQLTRTIPGFFSLFSYNRDRKNFKKIHEICIRTGKIPGFSDIGENLNKKKDIQDLSLLFRHFNLYEIQELEPYVLIGINEGEITPWGYASAYDYGMFKSMKVLERNKDTITFEFQFKFGVLSPYFLGIEYSKGNTEMVNENRNYFGLESIEDQIYKSRKKLSDFTCYPATKVLKSHRKELGRIWKRGKPWKKE